MHRQLLTVGNRRVVSNHFQAQHADNVIARDRHPAHRPDFPFRRCRNAAVPHRERRRNECPLWPAIAQQARRFQKHGHGRSIIVGAGCGGNRVVMSAKHDHFFGCEVPANSATKFDTSSPCAVRLPRNLVARGGELSLDERCRRPKCDRPAHVSRANQTGESIDVLAKFSANAARHSVRIYAHLGCASNSRLLSPRSTESEMGWFTGKRARIWCSSSTLVTSRSFTATIKSPTCRPERSAGPPGSKAATSMARIGEQIEFAHEPTLDRRYGRRDSQKRPADFPVGDQFADDPTGRVSRHGKTETLRHINHGGVDADHAAAAVDQWSAAVAGVQRRRVLDDAFDQPAMLRAHAAPSALTTPVETVESKPSGLPMAMTN